MIYCLIKLLSVGQFNQRVYAKLLCQAFTPSFYARQSQKRKKLLELIVFLRFWGLGA